MRRLGHELLQPRVAASHPVAGTILPSSSDMERAHVLIRLQSQLPSRDDDATFLRKVIADGITRTSATTVRLEHSDMSPGVASITFEQVYGQQHSSAGIFEQSLSSAVAKCAQGLATTLVLTGAPRSGKSFTCHGDKQQKVTESEPDFVFQVLLSCFHVMSEQLVDLMQSPPTPVLSSPVLTTDQVLLQRSVIVTNTAEAVHCYTQAHAKSVQATGGTSDFVVVVHVETKRPNEQVRRGRFACIDIHGSFILEPTRWQESGRTGPVNEAIASPRKPFFSDTHFPVATGLSNWFGGFVGNESTTYMLVTIQKQAQFQQQAIQSLLYACKAKDIKSTSTITYLSSFTSKKATQEQEITSDLPAKAADTSNESGIACGNQTEFDEASPPGSPASLTSSDSTSEFAVASNDIGYERLVTSTAGIGPFDRSERQSILSERLRKAYESVKSSSSIGDPLNSILVPLKSQDNMESGRGKHDRFEGLFATKANFLHARADAMLKTQTNELQALSLLDKLDLIHAQYQDIEKALSQEISIKEKCVDRISKLSQTMSFQVVEHEKQMQQVLEEKQRVQAQLTEVESKFGGVSNEIEQLQQQVQLMKASRSEVQAQVLSTVGAPPIVDNGSERALLQQFSSRLESAMEQAKGVVDFKDGVIRELERRLEESTQASAQVSKELARQKLSHEQEKTNMSGETRDLKMAIRHYEEEAANEAVRVEEEKSAFLANIDALTSEIECLNTKFSAQEREHARAFAQAVEDRSSYTDSNSHRLEELLARKARECIASQAASAASHRQVELLQARIENIIYKMGRKKKKMEKKMKALLSDRKLHKAESSRQVLDLTQQIEDSKAREKQMETEIATLHKAICDIEGNEAKLRSEVEQLQHTNSKLERRFVEIQQQFKVMKSETHDITDQHHFIETKFQQRISEMEQSLARRLLEREAQLAAEHERKLTKMIDRHAEELLHRDVHDEYAPRSASSLSTLSSTASDFDNCSPRQQSIDQLDALIYSKEKQYAQSRENTPSSDRKKPSSARQEQKLVELKKKLSELTQALAVANEQETLAKAQTQKVIDAHQASLSQRDHLLEEMNRLKNENWSLSLALQVTERQRQ